MTRVIFFGGHGGKGKVQGGKGRFGSRCPQLPCLRIWTIVMTHSHHLSKLPSAKDWLGEDPPTVLGRLSAPMPSKRFSSQCASPGGRICRGKLIGKKWSIVVYGGYSLKRTRRRRAGPDEQTNAGEGGKECSLCWGEGWMRECKTLYIWNASFSHFRKSEWGGRGGGGLSGRRGTWCAKKGSGFY